MTAIAAASVRTSAAFYTELVLLLAFGLWFALAHVEVGNTVSRVESHHGIGAILAKARTTGQFTEQSAVVGTATYSGAGVAHGPNCWVTTQ